VEQRLSLSVDGWRELSDFAIEELRYIVDDVSRRCAGAPADLVLMELRAYRRVRQLDAGVAEHLARDIASHGSQLRAI